MSAPDSGDIKRANATRTLHTTVRDPSYTIGNPPCKVCGTPIYSGRDSYRGRQYHFEYAHVGCGWFKPNDPTRHVHEVRRGGTDFVYYEWQCVTCKLDACSPRKPHPTDPLECIRCRPTPPMAPGVLVELIIPLSGPPTSRGKRTLYRPGERATVKKIGVGENERTYAWVSFRDTDPHMWVPASHLVTV